jgi:hypothetical protein
MNVMNHVDDVETILPRNGDACNITIVRYGQNNAQRKRHRDLVVDPHRVMKALKKLKEINIDYFDVKIVDNFNECVETIELNDSENVQNDVKDDEKVSETIEDGTEESYDESFCWTAHTNEECDKPMDDLVEETIDKWQSSCSDGSHILTPPSELKAVPSWDYISKTYLSFPFLFPSGKRIRDRTKISIQSFIRHCMNFYDDRFSKCIPFVFFCFNAMQSKKISGMTSE